MDGLELKQCGTPNKAAHERLLELAGVYRNLSRRELARALGRDSSKLMSANGNPKLDYVVRLAQLLDWPIGDVAEAICGDDDEELAATDESSFDELDAAARLAHRQGEFARMCQIARRMALTADTPDRRATAALREAGGWDGLGRHTQQLEAVRRGLQCAPTSPDLKLLLQSNLANACYTLSHFYEARGMAREIIESLNANPPTSRSARAAHAFSHYVLGNACRRLIDLERESAAQHAKAALSALNTAADMYAAIAEQFDHDPWRGIAQTCRGGIIEAEVELGVRTAADAIAVITREIGAAEVAGNSMVGDQLESLGWWCVFGGGIALRCLGGAELQRHMAQFTSKGYVIADRLGNWAMREQLFTMELMQRQRLNDLAGVSVEWMIDDDELRLIVGTMGRFPSFRRAGWRILQTATVIRST